MTEDVINFKEVREKYACYTQKGLKSYRRERWYVLERIADNRRIGVQKSLYYQHALAGLRLLGV